MRTVSAPATLRACSECGRCTLGVMALYYVESAPGVVGLLTDLEVFTVRRLDGARELPAVVAPAAPAGLDVRRAELVALDVARLPAGVTASPGALPLGTSATVLRGLWRLCSAESRPWWRPGLAAWVSGARLLPCVVLVVG